MQDNKKSIYSLTLNEMENDFVNLGLKRYVASQVYDWIYVKLVDNFDEMSNISKSNIELLKKNYFFDIIEIDTIQVDKKDGTIKFLLKLECGNLIEIVLMNFDYGYSVCLTSQVGCNMGCKFCASGLIKKTKNISVGEFVKEFVIAKKYLRDYFNQNLSHIVVMGIGEPFDNFENLIKFLEVVKQQKGLCISPRKITVSTCGLVPKIKEWTKLKNQVNLAVSLHASNDEIRNQIMPINRAYNMKTLLDAIDEYIAVSNRRVTIEYIMINDLNDKPEHAYELINLFKNKLVYINLIPYNAVFENSYTRSKKSYEFYDILKSGGLVCTIRQEKGTNIDAACGQLRSKKLGVI